MINSFKKLLPNKSTGIGLEISPERINIAQVAKQGQSYKLLKYCTAELDEGVFEEGKIVDSVALAESIQALISDNKIKAKRVATALPLREAMIRIIPVPAELDDKELRELIINQEAALYLPYPREEVDLDYQKLDFFQDDDGIEKVNILLVGTRQENTDSYVNTLKQANLEIDILEVNSFALMRTIRGQLQQFGDKEAVVLVDIEFDNTEIAIIVNGGPQFSRTVPIGTYQMQSALAKAMNLPISRNPEILQGMSIPATRFDSLSTQGTAVNPGMSALTRVVGRTDRRTEKID